jgi:ABC-2 type transport system permease protein
MTAIAVENVAPTRAVRKRPSTARLISIELQKMFDTRSGFWLMASIVILSVLATGAVILWAPDDELTYSTFAAAIGFPMTVVLPMIAVLSVTSEWTQRSGLTTFTLIPHRGRVIWAKAIASVLIGIVSMFVAMAVGAIGNLVGTAITGTDLVWDVSALDLTYIIIANVLGMMIGFMLGLLFRNSPGAIVAYFVYSFVLTAATEVLATSQEWFADIRPWVDFNFSQGSLFNGDVSAEQWGQLATSGFVWLVVPFAIGLRLVMRSEVK